MKLSDSFIYKDELGYTGYGAEIVNNITDYEVDTRELGLAWVLFSNLKNTPYVKQLQMLIERGVIRFYYKPGSHNVVPFIPYFSKKTNSYKVLVNITTYVTHMNEEVVNGGKIRTFDIDAKTLHGLALAAAGVLVSASTEDFKFNSSCREFLMKFYIDMWTTVLNRVTPIASSIDSVANFKYMMAYYLLAKYYNGDNDNCAGVAFKLSRPRNMDKLTEFATRWTPESLAPMNIKEFLETVLKEMIPQLSKIDVPKLIASFSSYYSSMNTLCIDYLPYIAGVSISYFNDFGIYRNKTLSRDLLKEARETAIVLEPEISNRLDFMIKMQHGCE